MTELRKRASWFFCFTVAFVALSLIGTLHIHELNSIAPLTTRLFLPNLFMLCAYIDAVFFVVTVMVWIIRGDQGKSENVKEK